jgi:hypothetical protein
MTVASASASASPTTQDSVSREEYQRLLQEQEQMRREIAELKAERNAPTTTPPATVALPPRASVAPSNSLPRDPVTREDLDDLEQQIRKVTDQVHSALPGTEHLTILGDAAVGFTNRDKSPSNFNLAFSPLFLWEPTSRLLVEAALDVGVDTTTDSVSSTSVDLTIANASFIVNDNLIVGGGLFVVPFGQYHNHFDPPWIEKLPDAPLAFGDNPIAPSSEVGIFARGAVPVRGLPRFLSSAKLTYDAYVTNGPGLITTDPAAAGSLNFDDFTDLNNGKAAGGRLGFLPFPNVEMGYSVQYAQAAPAGFRKAYVLLQAADLNWVQEVRPLGVFTTRAEWVWSEVEMTTFDPHGSLGFGPLNFNNYRTGGYVELAYRPTLIQNRVLRNLEFVFRYDVLRAPLKAPGGDHEQRYEFGIDYWLTPSAVLKVAYEIDNKKIGQGQNAFFIQLGLGL